MDLQEGQPNERQTNEKPKIGIYSLANHSLAYSGSSNFLSL
jgi:hypothetical protein